MNWLRKLLVNFLQIDFEEMSNDVNEESNSCQSCVKHSEFIELHDEITKLHKMYARLERKVYRGPIESEDPSNHQDQDLSWLRGIK